MADPLLRGDPTSSLDQTGQLENAHSIGSCAGQISNFSESKDGAAPLEQIAELVERYNAPSLISQIGTLAKANGLTDARTIRRHGKEIMQLGKKFASDTFTLIVRDYIALVASTLHGIDNTLKSNKEVLGTSQFWAELFLLTGLAAPKLKISKKAIIDSPSYEEELKTGPNGKMLSASIFPFSRTLFTAVALSTWLRVEMRKDLSSNNSGLEQHPGLWEEMDLVGISSALSDSEGNTIFELIQKGMDGDSEALMKARELLDGAFMNLSNVDGITLPLILTLWVSAVNQKNDTRMFNHNKRYVSGALESKDEDMYRFGSEYFDVKLREWLSGFSDEGSNLHNASMDPKMQAILLVYTFLTNAVSPSTFTRLVDSLKEIGGWDEAYLALFNGNYSRNYKQASRDALIIEDLEASFHNGESAEYIRRVATNSNIEDDTFASDQNRMKTLVDHIRNRILRNHIQLSIGHSRIGSIEIVKSGAILTLIIREDELDNPISGQVCIDITDAGKIVALPRGINPVDARRFIAVLVRCLDKVTQSPNEGLLSQLF